MMRSNKRLLAIILSFALVIAACFVFLLIPAQLSVKNTLSQLNKQQNFLKDINKRSGNLDSLKGDWDQSTGALKKLDERLAGGDEVVDLVMMLENLSDKLSIIQEVSVVRQTEENSSIFLKNNLSGDFAAIMKYIKGVENLKYIVEIDSCDFYKQAGSIKAELALRIPIYKK